ncbi:hypothetical protein BC830DRAFT_1218077 [Chytriomyces sp. MP71]|nr:hypothetical protein BC830DRAFT_1218077 [Chytriomyces sp. MP71]
MYNKNDTISVRSVHLKCQTNLNELKWKDLDSDGEVKVQIENSQDGITGQPVFMNSRILNLDIGTSKTAGIVRVKLGSKGHDNLNHISKCEKVSFKWLDCASRHLESHETLAELSCGPGFKGSIGSIDRIEGHKPSALVARTINRVEFAQAKKALTQSRARRGRILASPSSISVGQQVWLASKEVVYCNAGLQKSYNSNRGKSKKEKDSMLDADLPIQKKKRKSVLFLEEVSIVALDDESGVINVQTHVVKGNYEDNSILSAKVDPVKDTF